MLRILLMDSPISIYTNFSSAQSSAFLQYASWKFPFYRVVFFALLRARDSLLAYSSSFLFAHWVYRPWKICCRSSGLFYFSVGSFLFSYEMKKLLSNLSNISFPTKTLKSSTVPSRLSVTSPFLKVWAWKAYDEGVTGSNYSWTLGSWPKLFILVSAFMGICLCALAFRSLFCLACNTAFLRILSSLLSDSYCTFSAAFPGFSFFTITLLLNLLIVKSPLSF